MLSKWTPGRYIAFSTAWVGFALAALLISSIKLAAKAEDIYRQAAFRLADAESDYRAIEKQLREIGSSTPLKMLGPIERAEVIRFLGFRKLPIELFGPCLNAVETLSVITEVELNTITIFVSDFLRSFPVDSTTVAHRLVDILYEAIRESPVPPHDFFAAFSASRRLLLTQTVSPHEFLQGLRECLESGVAPGDTYEELRARFQ